MSKHCIINCFFDKIIHIITKKKNISHTYICTINKLNSAIYEFIIQTYFSCSLHFLIEKNSKGIKFSKLKIYVKSRRYQ